ncbi:MAG: SDR family oxidoreductase [Pseudomonadales bacterium]|nr:SDR family oxidoreductase [Pseudomonadales bacterium]
MNHVAIITGGSGGIGQALCQEFREAGYLVISLDKKPNPLEDITSLEFDLKSLQTSAQRDRLRSQIMAVLHSSDGSLKVLVNNAAVQLLDSLEDLDIPDFEESLFVNLTVPLILSKLFYEDLVASGGTILNIGSIHARLTKPGFVSYATSKAGLVGLTRAMAVDLGNKIRVNCILPAAIETPMLKAGFSDNPSGLDELKSYHPAGKIGEPRDVASLAVYLASCESRFLSGSCIDIDGAIGARLHDPS